MFFQSSRRLAFLLGRALGLISNVSEVENSRAPDVRFELRVEKEMTRCRSRPSECEFAILETNLDPAHLTLPLRQFLFEARRRLRITDEQGVWQDRIHFLLPETDRAGAKTVANNLLSMARRAKIKLDLELWSYPEDDIQVLQKTIQGMTQGQVTSDHT